MCVCVCVYAHYIISNNICLLTVAVNKFLKSFTRDSKSINTSKGVSLQKKKKLKWFRIN